MEHLFKQTDLESRYSLNMNELLDGRMPKVPANKTYYKIILITLEIF